MDTVRARWGSRRQFVAWDRAGHGVVMDATSEYGGEGAGPRPLEMVLYGLAACTGMDVVSILEKKRQDLVGLEVLVTARQREEDFPRYYERIEVEYLVTGRGVAPAAVERAIELSESKYCSVRGMFGPHVEVVTSFQVSEAGTLGNAAHDPQEG